MLSHLKRFLGDQDDLGFEGDLYATLDAIADLRERQLGRGKQHVVFYASGFLHGSNETGSMISLEDIDGFMTAFRGVKGKSLTLILHTPGGLVGPDETIVEYLHSKCEYIEVIVPAYALSAGAMICLASDHLIISKAGQLGPLDTQMFVDGKYSSAQVIKEGFERASAEVKNNKSVADLWAPTDPSTLVDAEKSMAYSKQLVSGWLAKRKLLRDKSKVQNITAYFNAEPNSGYGQVYYHGQRIGLDKLREMGLSAAALEDNQDLQDAVMEAYWQMRQFFEDMTADKFIASNNERFWIKPTAEQPQP